MRQWWEKSGNKVAGVSRDGRNMKIHTLVGVLGNPLAFVLSFGNDHDSKHAIPLLSQVDIEGGATSSAIKSMGPRQYETISTHKMLTIQFRRRAASMTRGFWTGTSTRSAIWWSASFRNPNSFAGYLHATTNSIPHSRHLFLLTLLPFC